MILKILLIALAAISKALVDTIAFHGGGVFKGNGFFDINKQGKFLPLTKYPFDGFHLFNSLMIGCFIAAIIFKNELKWYWQFLILSAIFILVFNLFWNLIFNSKKQ